MITRLLNRVSIRIKIIIITILASFIALVFFCAAFLFSDFKTYTGQVMQNTVEVANLLGKDNDAALEWLAFESAQSSVYEVLASYPHIRYGGIFNQEGETLFAFYDRERKGRYIPEENGPSAEAMARKAADSSINMLIDSGFTRTAFYSSDKYEENFLLVRAQSNFIPEYRPGSEDAFSSFENLLEAFWKNGYIDVYVPIRDSDDEVISTAFVRAELDQVYDRYWRYINTMVTIVFITMALVYVLAIWLQKYISSPITEFARQANRISVAKDYTMRFKSENRDEIGDLQKAFNKVLVTVKNQQDALVKAKEHAENSARAKERFLANMSHELRTPMHAIKGYTQLVAATNPLASKQREYIDIINDSAQDLLQLIDDILDQSKIEAGKMEFEASDIDLRGLVKKLLLGQQTRVNEAGLAARACIAPELPTLVVGDPLRLKQVLLNLFSNAIKFTSEGEIVIGAELINQDAGSCRIRFYVKDTGIGIEKEKQDMIFNLFSQASSDTTRKYGGTGLGLSISRSLVELQGGTMYLQSTPGQGSTFFFEMTFKKAEAKENAPATADAAEALVPEQAGQGATKDGKPVKILVAEDNELNQRLLKAMLKQYNYRVDVAPNGQVAYEKFLKHHYDFILLDVHMPELDGYDTARKIRESNRQIPVMAMTASALKGEAEKCLAVGMNDYISKPFTRQGIHSKIQKWVNNDGKEPEAENANTVASAQKADRHVSEPRQ